ncbi:hypothetical protein AAFF_G00394000 [Aldrovandia affinis]|uniref:Dynein regulatory complex subunit 2 n=1 Tax=Aldrovandia affinis TaxID=143900 RepID=A0AAD7WKR2_9TELE|nr:hypothetical protein AAFF_G00394000 [Aldrovandia affinis]
MAKKGKKEEDTGSSDLDTDEESECSIKSKDFVEKEMVKKKQAMLTQFLQDKLLKEERYGVINLYKLTEKWRTVFRQMRSKELQQDIVLLSCHIQRVMEQKDTIIKGLLCELDEANDYLAPVLCSYMQCINQHLESQKGMVALLEHRWTEMLQEISADLEVDKSLIACQHKERCMRMEELNFAFDQYYNDIETEERQDFQSVYSDLQCKTSEERDALRLSLENNVEVAWHKARDTLWDYNESTLESYAGIQLLMDEDQQLVDEIEDDVLMIKELQDSIVVFRSKVHKAANRPKGSLQKVKDEVDAEAEIIKTEMSTSRSRDRNYLTILVSQIDGARKKLQALILKGEKMMRVSGLCQKLEKTWQKMFYTVSPYAEEQVMSKILCSESISEEMAESIHDQAVMDTLWRPYNTALKECLCLREDLVQLRKQNRQLHIQLQILVASPLKPRVKSPPRPKQPQDQRPKKPTNPCRLSVVELTF